MSKGTSGSGPAREYDPGDDEQIPVEGDADTPPGEGQIPAHEPQDTPAESDTETLND